ncbi:phage integrase N-terminal SAM-like domain-containing protein, partial [Pontiellaceae bacterium B12227]|nr:phage integrase N-terminal SAM-like domain-containing protein [Pontiellaceae bacterium B12227]
MSERDLVPERHRSFYARWVWRFLQSELNASTLSEQDQVTGFLDQLTREPSVEEWQVNQAERAVKLYLNVFLPEDKRARPEERGQAEAAAVALASSEAEAMLELKNLLRLRHYAYRTEKTYIEWVTRYLKFSKEQGIEWRKSGSVRLFLSHLALQKSVASSTQNQALNALVFFFRETLREDLEKLDAVRARRGRKLPVVLSAGEVKRLLDEVEGTKRLMLALTYGAGLRVSETIRLRVKDLDFENDLLFVRSGKGDKDRATLLPEQLVDQLKEHLQQVKGLHERDLKAGHGA